MEEITDGVEAQGNGSSPGRCCDELAARDVDRISELPDDILVPIITELTLKDATATAVLSSRWRHLHTRINRLSLPAFENPTSWREDYIEAQSKKLPDFVSSINRILDSCQDFRAFYEFRLRSPDLEGLDTDFERWLEFAFTREVQIIDIRIVCYRFSNWELPYAFSISTLIAKNGPQLPSFKSLKELHLRDLTVDDRELELVVSNFTLLEHLSIDSCPYLKNVCVAGNSMRLKRLDICWCLYVESIHVTDMTNLVSLRCHKLNKACVLMLDNVPNLAEFATSDHHILTSDDVTTFFRLQSSILDQLSHLQLHLRPNFHILKTGKASYMVPKLINVKHLELQVDACDYSGVHFATFVNACPSLEKLEITCSWRGSTKFKKRETIPCLFPTKPPNKHLKHVWFSGFVGCSRELDFVFYIIEKAVALEEFIIEGFGGKARARAWRHIRPATPASVNLIIL